MILLQAISIRALRREGLLQSRFACQLPERGAKALRRGDGTSRTPSPYRSRPKPCTPCRGRRPRRPAADTIVYRFCLRNSRRDEGIAPYARFRIERNIFPLLRRAGCPQPAAAGTSILLQTIPKRAPRRGGQPLGHGFAVPGQKVKQVQQILRRKLRQGYASRDIFWDDY